MSRIGSQDVRVEAERELADVARARVAVENLVQALGVVGRGLDDRAPA